MSFLDKKTKKYGEGFSQGRIIHCAGCTMGEAPVARGPADQLLNFYHAVLTFERSVYA